MADATIAVSTGNDDGQETDAGVVTLTTSALDCDSTGDHIGFIIRDLPVPPGDTIVTAYLQVYPHDSGRQSPNVTIQAELNPANFAASNNDLSGRTKIGDTQWVASNIGIDAYKNSPSIVSTLQAIVDDPGYSQGDDVAFFLIQNSSSNWLRISSYNRNSAEAPQLYVEWEPATPPAEELTYAWPHDHWPEGYWSEYWPDYGEEEPPETGIVPLLMYLKRMRG